MTTMTKPTMISWTPWEDNSSDSVPGWYCETDNDGIADPPDGTLINPEGPSQGGPSRLIRSHPTENILNNSEAGKRFPIPIQKGNDQWTTTLTPSASAAQPKTPTRATAAMSHSVRAAPRRASARTASTSTDPYCQGTHGRAMSQRRLLEGTPMRKMEAEQLLALLIDGGANNSITRAEDDAYIDWSSQDKDGVKFELGDGTDAVSTEWSWEEIKDLHRRLTITILNHEMSGTGTLTSAQQVETVDLKAVLPSHTFDSLGHLLISYVNDESDPSGPFGSDTERTAIAMVMARIGDATRADVELMLAVARDCRDRAPLPSANNVVDHLENVSKNWSLHAS